MLHHVEIHIGISGPEVHISAESAVLSRRRLREVACLKNSIQILISGETTEIPSEARGVRAIPVKAIGIVVASAIPNNRARRIGYWPERRRTKDVERKTTLHDGYPTELPGTQK